MRFIISLIIILIFFSCKEQEKTHDKEQRYLFFLHNRFIETHDLHEAHPVYGKTQYNEIVNQFTKYGFTVISEKRTSNVNARVYASTIVHQIDSLIKNDIPAQHITVVGTSKGGYIAQYVSTIANNEDLNFVFIASFRNEDIENIPTINYCGRILTIYEKTDPYGVSALKRKGLSTCNIEYFNEIELNTGTGHGFIFQPLDEWIEPTVKWANGNYDLD